MHVLSVADPDMVTELVMLTSVVHLYKPGESVRPPISPTGTIII